MLIDRFLAIAILIALGSISFFLGSLFTDKLIAMWKGRQLKCE